MRRVKKRIQLGPSTVRLATRNGRELSEVLDGRSSIARRYKELLADFIADLGGDHGNLSAAQHTLARRCATLTLEAERFELDFATGTPKPNELEAYLRVVGVLKRLFESVGINRGRIARPINEPTDLQSYIRSKSNGRVRILDGEVVR